MTYRVEMLRQAEHDLDRLPGAVTARVAVALRGLAEDPRPHGTRPLKGALRGLYRIRVGEWRVAYQVDDGRRTVCIVEVAHCSTVYERAGRRRPSP